MKMIRPFEVGTTVKWCDSGRECAGIVVEIHTGSNHTSEVDPAPSYVIRCPDLSEAFKSHEELVVV